MKKICNNLDNLTFVFQNKLFIDFSENIGNRSCECCDARIIVYEWMKKQTGGIKSIELQRYKLARASIFKINIQDTFKRFFSPVLYIKYPSISEKEAIQKRA